MFLLASTFDDAVAAGYGGGYGLSCYLVERKN